MRKSIEFCAILQTDKKSIDIPADMCYDIKAVTESNSMQTGAAVMFLKIERFLKIFFKNLLTNLKKHDIINKLSQRAAKDGEG